MIQIRRFYDFVLVFIQWKTRRFHLASSINALLPTVKKSEINSTFRDNATIAPLDRLQLVSTDNFQIYIIVILSSQNPNCEEYG